MSILDLFRRKKYINKRQDRGLYVEAQSADQQGPTPAVKASGEVCHVVTIENNRYRPVDVVCKGRIYSNPQRVKFSLLLGDPLIAANEWTARTRIKPYQRETFDHVELLPGNVNGEETVHAEVEGRWPDLTNPARSRTAAPSRKNQSSPTSTS